MRPSPHTWALVLTVLRALPPDAQRALAGVGVEELAPHELPDRLADAGDGLIRLRSDIGRHPAAEAIIAHELAHEFHNHTALVRARPHLAALAEQAADAQARLWGFPPPR